MSPVTARGIAVAMLLLGAARAIGADADEPSRFSAFPDDAARAVAATSRAPRGGPPTTAVLLDAPTAGSPASRRVPAARLRGLVLDELGAPAKGIRVGAAARTFDGHAHALATTKADGTFEIDVPDEKARVVLVAQRGDWALGRSVTWVDRSRPRRAVLHLEAATPVAGTLVSGPRAEPVVGARVVTLALEEPPELVLRGESAWHALSRPHACCPVAATVTDQHGGFTAARPPGGVVALASRGGALAALSQGVNSDPAPKQQPAWAEPSRLAPAPPGELTIAGRITAAGVPVAGAVAWLRPLRAGGSRAIEADAEGRFVATGLATGKWSITVSAPGHAAAGRVVVARAVGVGALETFELLRLGRVAVTCVDAKGAPLDGVRVVAEPVHFVPPVGGEEAWQGWPDDWAPHEPLYFSTEHDGRVEVTGWPAGTCLRLIATRPGHAPATLACVVADAERPPSARLVLAPAAIVRGRVLAPGGRPRPGATVALVPDRSAALANRERGVETDALGTYEVRDLAAGLHELSAAAEGWLDSEPAHVTLASGRTHVIDLVLEAGAALEGVVLDELDAPAAGAKVELQLADHALGRRRDALPDVVSGPDGKFRAAPLRDGRRFVVTATRGLERSLPRVVVANADPVTLRMVPALGRIEGTVLAGGPPAARFWVSCKSATPPEARPVQGAEGRFVLEDLAPGTYTCEASDADLGDGSAAGVVVEAGATTRALIPLARPHVMHVEVRSAGGGEPLANASIRGSLEQATTDAMGSAEVSVSRTEAEPVLWVSATGHESLRVPLGPPPPPRLTVTLQASERVSIAGRVLAPDGSPALGARVTAHEMVGVDAEGRFRFDGIAPGPHRLSATRERPEAAEEATLDVDVPREGLDGLSLRLAPVRTGALRLVALDGGEPAPLTHVQVLVPNRPAMRGITDESGVHVAEALPPGTHSVLLARSNERLREAGRVTIVPDVVADVELEIPGGKSLSGRVVSGGIPVEGASLVLTPSALLDPRAFGGIRAALESGGSPSWTRTDSRGEFRYELLSATFARARLDVEVQSPLPAGTRQRERLELSLDAPETSIEVDLGGVAVAGQVTSRGGAVPGALVTASKASGSDRAAEPVAWTYTDAGGEFAFDALMTGATHVVAASKDGLGRGEQAVTPGAAERVTITLAREGPEIVLRGQGRDGPVREALSLRARGPGGATLMRREWPDAAGDTRWIAPAAGAWEALVHAEGHAPALVSVTTDEPADVTLSSGGRVELTVTDSRGAPVEGAVAIAESWDGRPPDHLLGMRWLQVPPGRAATSDSRGTLELVLLPPGRHVLSVRRGADVALVEAEVREGEITRVAVSLPSSG